MCKTVSLVYILIHSDNGNNYITFHLAVAFIQSDLQKVHSTMRVQTQNNKNKASNGIKMYICFTCIKSDSSRN